MRKNVYTTVAWKKNNNWKAFAIKRVLFCFLLIKFWHVCQKKSQSSWFLKVVFLRNELYERLDPLQSFTLSNHLDSCKGNVNHCKIRLSTQRRQQSSKTATIIIVPVKSIGLWQFIWVDLLLRLLQPLCTSVNNFTEQRRIWWQTGRLWLAVTEIHRKAAQLEHFNTSDYRMILQKGKFIFVHSVSSANVKICPSWYTQFLQSTAFYYLHESYQQGYMEKWKMFSSEWFNFFFF